MTQEQILHKPFILILGAPRSGTTWLHALLSQHPSVASHPYELTIFSQYLGPIQWAWKGEKRGLTDEVNWKNGMPTLWSEETYQEVQSYLVASAYKPLVESHPAATHILDKHPKYSLYGELIMEMLPNVKILHMLRDGREVVTSMRSAANRMGFGAEKIVKGATDWKEHVQAVQRLAQSHPNKVLEIRYETLHTDLENQLNRIVEFVGLDAQPDWIQDCVGSTRKVGAGNPNADDKARKAGTIWKSQLSLYDRLDVDRVAGDMLVRLGYAPNRSWPSNSPLKLALFKIYYSLSKLFLRLKRATNFLLTGQLSS